MLPFWRLNAICASHSSEAGLCEALLLGGLCRLVVFLAAGREHPPPPSHPHWRNNRRLMGATATCCVSQLLVGAREAR